MDRITSFAKLSLDLELSFTNESYQERASEPYYVTYVFPEEQSDTYKLQLYYPTYDEKYITAFAITGEYNIMFNIVGRSLQMGFGFMRSIYITKDAIRNIIKHKTYEYTTQVYVQGIRGKPIAYDMIINFIKSKNTLIISSIEVDLPKDRCDKWYEMFINNIAQRKITF